MKLRDLPGVRLAGMILCDRGRRRLGADCRDSPQELERARLTRIQVAGPCGASEEEVLATGEGRGAFLRIRRKLLPLPPLRPCFCPRLLQDARSTPLSSAGVSLTTGRGPKPCPLGCHRLFPVSRDHFAVQAPSAPFSTDGTILTPGKAAFMTTVPADHFPRL